jgi:hypothetical protein
LRSKIIGTPKKFLKNGPVLYLGQKNYRNHLCHQEPNPSRETIPLNEKKTKSFSGSGPP